MSQSAAPVAASPASFQPEKAATSSGRRRFGCRSQTRPSVIEPAYGQRSSVPVYSSSMGLCRPPTSTASRSATAACSGTGDGAFPTSWPNPTCASRSTTPRSTSRSATIRSYRDLAVAKDPDTGEEFSAYYRIPRSTDDLLAPLAAHRDGHRPRRHDGHADQGDRLRRAVRPPARARGRGARAGAGVLRALPRRRPRGRRRPDRREGRPVPGAARAARSRPLRARRRGARRRHRRARREVPHEHQRERARDHRAADAGDGTRRRRLRGRRSPCRWPRPGLSLYVSAYGARDHDSFEFPISSKHKMLETLTVFDDVFVPWERVFLCREPERAGAVSNSFVEYHRFTAVSYKLPLLDALDRHRRADRRDERRGQGRPHPRQAHPARSPTRRRCGPSPRWPRSGRPSTTAASPTPTR